ncbi:creatininase family protein [Acidianus sp. HS-5]|uniref:creatininase family protein n=1 Tax=Acidianus sp. HS-5 TaxID=2886040 RepID=UPI001F447B63|nr:creatininase family protein [Acidianus sp. HS-5]BDC18599.1 creatininase [Acidianus sp. HS-5]
MYLLYSTRDEIKDKVSLIPVGSIEQHGPHLPMGSDSIIAEEIVKRVEEEMKDYVLLFPTIYYTCSIEHGNFPYVGVSYVTFFNYMVEVVKKALEFSKAVVIINAHGGNQAVLELVKREINFKNKKKVYIFYPDYDFFQGKDLHAGTVESSVIKYLYPSLVKENRLGDDFSVKEGVFDTITTSEANPQGIINIGEFKIDISIGEKFIRMNVKKLKDIILKIIEKST